jgi:hypothetical protein
MKKLDLLTILLSVLIFALFNSCSQINDSSDDFIFDLQLSEAYSNSELFPILTEINDFLKQELKDSIDAEETGVDLLDKMIQEDKAPQSVDTEFPLWSILYPSVQHDSGEIAKIVDGESFALIIRLKSSFTNKLDGATYVINCKIDTREYLIPLDKQTLMQPIPIGILSEKEKDLLIERFPEIVID